MEGAFADSWLEGLGGCEPQERAIVTAATMRILTGQPTQPLTASQAALLALRFQWATGLAMALSAAEEAATTKGAPMWPGPDTQPGKLRWLLVEAWECLGQHQWMVLGYWQHDWQP
jgi:hypothetical protein